MKKLSAQRKLKLRVNAEIVLHLRHLDSRDLQRINGGALTTYIIEDCMTSTFPPDAIV